MDRPKIRFEGYTDAWEQRKLGEICERVTRKNKNNESDLPLTIASQFGLIDQRDFFNKVVAAKDMSNYYLLKKGEYAYNKSYSNGFDYGSIKRLNAYEQGCLSTLYICFGVSSEEVETDYLECFFDTLKWYGDVSMICAEGARNHGLLNVDTKGFFDEVTIDLPKSLEEQKKISAYLNDLDKLVTLHQRKREQVKKLKKYMLQNMFPQNGEVVPKIRFSGFTEAWEQRKLDDMVEFLDTQRKPLEGSKRVSGPYPYYGASGVVDYVDDYIFDEELVLLSEDGANITDRNYPVCFIISGKTWVNNHAHVLKTKIGFDNSFLCNSLERKDYTPYNTGMAMPKLNKEVCKNIPVDCPNYEEQQKIGAYLDRLDNLITLHQHKCEELQNIKKYMLQNMFV